MHLTKRLFSKIQQMSCAPKMPISIHWQQKQSDVILSYRCTNGGIPFTFPQKFLLLPFKAEHIINKPLSLSPKHETTAQTYIYPQKCLNSAITQGHILHHPHLWHYSWHILSAADCYKFLSSKNLKCSCLSQDRSLCVFHKPVI